MYKTANTQRPAEKLYLTAPPIIIKPAEPGILPAKQECLCLQADGQSASPLVCEGRPGYHLFESTSTTKTHRHTLKRTQATYYLQ